MTSESEKLHGTLTLFIHRATNLIGADDDNKSDPYVIITLKDENKNKLNQFRTKVKKRTINPIWEEQFTYEIKHPLSVLFINFNLYDQDLTQDDFLGTVRFEITAGSTDYGSIQHRQVQPKNKEKVRGSISFTLDYHPLHESSTSKIIKGKVGTAEKKSKSKPVQKGSEFPESKKDQKSRPETPTVPHKSTGEGQGQGQSQGQDLAWTIPEGITDYLSQWKPELFFYEGVLKITVIEAIGKDPKPHIYYVTISVGNAKSRTKLSKRTAKPEWKFDWMEVINDIGTPGDPVLIELSLFQNSTRLKKPEILGIVIFPLVNFSDDQPHELFLDLMGPSGETSEWKIRVKIHFEALFTTWPTFDEVNREFESLLGSLPPKDAAHLQKTVVAPRDKWHAVEQARSKVGKSVGSPIEMVEALETKEITVEQAKLLQTMLSRRQDRDAVRWTSNFINIKGVYYLFDYIRSYSTRYHSPAHHVTDDEKELLYFILGGISALKSHPSELVAFDHMRILVSILDIVDPDQICLLLELLAKLCTTPGAAEKVKDAIHYLVYCSPEQWKGLVEQLMVGPSLLFKIYFLQVINATLITTKEKTAHQMLRDFYIENGLTYDQMSKLISLPDDELRQQINEFFEQTEMEKSSETKASQLIKELHEVQQKYEKEHKLAQKHQKTIRSLKETFKSAEAQKNAEEAIQLQAELAALRHKVSDLMHEKNDLTEELEGLTLKEKELGVRADKAEKAEMELRAENDLLKMEKVELDKLDVGILKKEIEELKTTILKNSETENSLKEKIQQI